MYVAMMENNQRQSCIRPTGHTGPVVERRRLLQVLFAARGHRVQARLWAQWRKKAMPGEREEVFTT